MNLGGFDISIAGTTTINDINVILQHVKQNWPTAVFKLGNAKEVSEIASEDFFPISGVIEFFAYTDYKSCESWRKNGLTKNNADKIICFYIESDNIGVVVEAPGSKTHEIVKTFEFEIQKSRVSV